MSAWSSEFDAITTRSERAIRDAIQPRSIETEKRINLGSPAAFRQQMTNAAQISFTLFADCSYKQQRTLNRYSLVLNGLGVRDEGRESTAVIRDSRRIQFLIAFDDREIRVFWKYCIEMCADDDERLQ